MAASVCSESMDHLDGLVAVRMVVEHGFGGG